jgi:hypothetical protein
LPPLTISRPELVEIVERTNRLAFDSERMQDQALLWARTTREFEAGGWGTGPGCAMRQLGFELQGPDEVVEWSNAFDRAVLRRVGLEEEASLDAALQARYPELANQNGNADEDDDNFALLVTVLDPM